MEIENIHRDELYNLINLLDKQDFKVAFDFLEFLVQRSSSNPGPWEKVYMIESDCDPLS